MNEPTIAQTIEAHLREVMDLKIDGVLARFNDRMLANDAAVNEAKESIKTRLESMNELRAQINTERGTYASRDMVDARATGIETAVNTRITAIQDAAAADRREVRGWQDTVNKYMAAGAGRETGIGQSWGVLIAVAGIAVAGIAVVVPCLGMLISIAAGVAIQLIK